MKTLNEWEKKCFNIKFSINKIFFRNEGNLKEYSDKQKVREFITSKSALKRMLISVSQAQENHPRWKLRKTTKE